LLQNRQANRIENKIKLTYGVVSIFSIFTCLASIVSMKSIASSEFGEIEPIQKKLFKSQFPEQKDKTTGIISSDYSMFNSCGYSTRPVVSDDSPYSYQTNLEQSKNSKRFNIENIIIDADEIPVNNLELIKLTGNVSMITESSILKADQLVRNKTNGVDQAIGQITLETDESLLMAKDFLRDGKTQTMTLSDVEYHYFAINGNGNAESIEVNQSSDVSTLKNLTFSTCPKGDGSWLFSADELALDTSKGWAEAWGMWFKLKGIPIFYFPYFNFPIDDQRKSGFLMPDVSRNSRNGLDVRMPIYWNIQPNMDATFVPRDIRSRGNQLGIEYRYLTEKTSNRLAVEALSNDSLAKKSLVSNPELGLGNYGLSEDRWGIAFNNQTRWNKNWSATISASKVSDRDYFRDLGTGLINQNSNSSESLLESYGSISYVGNNWSSRLFLESTQSLVGQEPYRKTPSFVSRAIHFDQSSGLFLEFDSEIANFTHTDKERTHGMRVNLMPSVSLPYRNAYSWFTPKLAFQSTHYEQETPLLGSLSSDELSLSRNLPIFSLDTGLIFDRRFSINKALEKSEVSDNRTKTKQVITHTLEPRLFYAYIPFKEQSEINNFDTRLPDFSFNQLWRANRFSGSDRIGDTNHVALALTNRFTDNASGREIASFSLGRKYFFDRRQVTLFNQQANQQDSQGYSNSLLTGSSLASLPSVSLQGELQSINNRRAHQVKIDANRIEQSALLAEFSYRASSSLELTSYIEWDDSDGQGKGTKKARSRVKYEPIANHVVNLSHRVRNEFGNKSEEIDVSFLWPVNNRWRVVGKWYNDLKNNRTIETLFGVEYKSCCWAVSFVSRRYLDVRLDAFGNPVDIDSSQGLGNEFENSLQLDFNIILGKTPPKNTGIAKLIKNSIRNL